MADSEQKEEGSWWDRAKAAWAASNPTGDMVSKAVHWGEDKVKSGVNSWEDTTAGWGKSMAEATEGIPVVEQLGSAAGWVTKNYVGEYAGGFTKAAAGMVGGLANAVAHPADTALALAGMAEHIPIVGTINKAAHAAWDVGVNDLDPMDAVKRMSPMDDVDYWKNVGKGLIKPMAESWGEGKYGDAIGQVACNVAALALGAGEAGAAGKAATVADGAEAANAMRAVTKVADGVEAANGTRALSKLGEGAEAVEGADATRGANAAKGAASGAEGAETASGARAAGEAEAGAATRKPRIPEGDPEISVVEKDPVYHEPPKDLMREPKPKPEGMSDAAYEDYKKGIENHNQAVEQNSQIASGREVQQKQIAQPGEAKPELPTAEPVDPMGEVKGESGHYDPLKDKPQVNVTKDGKPMSSEEIGSAKTHETTHAAQKQAGTYEAPHAAGEEAAAERVITREQEAAAAEARTAAEQVERCAEQGELYPPKKVVGPDGTVDYVGEAEAWADQEAAARTPEQVATDYKPDADAAREVWRKNEASQAASDAALERELAEMEAAAEAAAAQQ